MIKILEQQIIKTQKEIETLYNERSNAGIEAEGEYDNKIDRKRRFLEKIEKDILNFKKASTPEETNIYCFVLVSTLDKIKHNLDDSCLCRLEDGRYHKTDCKQWKPFQNEDCIDAILEEYKKCYPINISYLDGDVSDELLILIDENLEQSIAIVDLFSLDEQNKQTAVMFDSNKVAGLITPKCRTLHEDLYTHASKMEKYFKRLNARVNKDLPHLYCFDVSVLRSFKSHLTNILTNKFPITNRCTVQSAVRSLNMNLS